MPTEPVKTDLVSLFVTKENILAILGLFVLFLSLTLLAGIGWGLLVLGIGLIVWSIVVALSRDPRRRNY